MWEGWGTALKPAWEPIILARKPLVGTVAANVEAHGTGALNVDGCRIEGVLDGDPHRFAETDGGSFVAAFKMPPTVRAVGRWPANVVLDEEAAAMLDEQSGDICTRQIEKPSDCAEDGHWGTLQGRRGARGYSDVGGASRFFYCGKADRSERNAGLSGMPERMPDNAVDRASQREGKEGAPGRGSLSLPRANHHPTVKPLDLMRWLVRLVTPPGGLVLDPFAGSGSTGCAAVLEGFRFLGMEQDAEYVEIAQRRIAFWETHYQPSLAL